MCDELPSWENKRSLRHHLAPPAGLTGKETEAVANRSSPIWLFCKCHIPLVNITSLLWSVIGGTWWGLALCPLLYNLTNTHYHSESRPRTKFGQRGNIICHIREKQSKPMNSIANLSVAWRVKKKLPRGGHNAVWSRTRQPRGPRRAFREKGEDALARLWVCAVQYSGPWPHGALSIGIN